ncbi:MAG: hypothetical protein VKN17_08060 [Cyanobacteriota bacterium]|jgi:hypothetical protein|nr:hypothetical protein [Synechococcus sp. FGCU3]MEB3105716.1 hypothetical protein [Cyanobacteriota bacterium]
MAVQKIRWYVKAQLGVLLLPAGLCLFGEAVIRRGLEQLAASAQVAGSGGSGVALNFLKAPGPWFWYGTLGLILINAGVGLMIESGLLRGYPGRR